MRCNFATPGGFPSFGNESDDTLSMLLIDLFGGIAELRAEVESLLGADARDVEKFRRELNRIEAEACVLRAASLMRFARSGH
jgi:hypothetical protein